MRRRRAFLALGALLAAGAPAMLIVASGIVESTGTKVGFGWTLGYTLVNDFGGGRVLADRLGRLLERFPNVVAWVNGHTHEHRITPHPRPDGGGWWEITTSSHVDWPQQSRLIDRQNGSKQDAHDISVASAPCHQQHAE